ncbi:hypothetical protein Tco_0952691 [Tanacetum coccineum]|uniref:Uncharacterized protein n=1 Tax=Tanacetum coccineum TaxID=301880 RepID=A0ABQ5DXS0_9ASTR
MVKTGLVEAIDSLVPIDKRLATFRGYYSRGIEILGFLKCLLHNIARGHDNILVWGILETDIQQKDKNKAKKDKNGHENEKSVKKQSKSKSQPRESQ